MTVNPCGTSFLAFLGSQVAIAIGLAAPAIAYTVTLQPTAPRLGETISVEIRAEQPTSTEPPQIRLGDRTYPSFAVPSNGLPRFRALLPTSPLDTSGRVELQVSGQEETRNLALGLQGRSFRTQSIWLPPGDEDLGTDFEFDRVDEFKTLVSPERHWSGPLVRPSQGFVSTEYGVQRYYNGVFAEDYYHRGVDYAANTGAPVVSPAAGYVRLVGYEANGFEIHGNTIGIDHGQGVLSIMIHLNSIDVKEGDFVQAGQRIGGIGNTGASTGPHLHWGLYVHGVAVDPVPWRREGID
ncbi:MAG: M23 family metallopeptidase [Cyanobacteria bacterium J06639_1]